MNDSSAAFNPEALLRDIAWERTVLGPRAQWPRSLEALLGFLMRSRRPQYLVWGPERRFFYNAAFLPVMGIKHPAGFGQPMGEIWPEVWREIEPLVSACIDEGESMFFEDRPFVLRRHGHDEQTYFSFSYTPVQDDTGTIAGLMCVLEERTSGIAAETRRQEELQRMRRLFKQAPGFMCVTQGPEHRIALVNDAYERLVGQPGATLVGQRVADALPEVIEQGFITLLDHVYAYAEPFVGRAVPVLLGRIADGPLEQRFVDFIYQPIHDDDAHDDDAQDGEAHVIGILTQGADVTDRVHAEAALRSANERKDQFLAVLGHELRNPLAPIHTAADNLAQLVGDDPRAQRCVEIIARQTRQMATLVEDLVDVARITNNLITLDRKVLDLRAIVHAAVEQTSARATERGHDVRVDGPDAPVLVHGDAFRLTQVFANLLSNAVRYTPEGGEIRIVLTSDAATAVVSVEDNGEGIAAELIPELFVPFVQAARSTERTGGGLGVGLSLAKRLVEAHGGRIRVESEGPGRGSCFTVELPLA